MVVVSPAYGSSAPDWQQRWQHHRLLTGASTAANESIFGWWWEHHHQLSCQHLLLWAWGDEVEVSTSYRSSVVGAVLAEGRRKRLCVMGLMIWLDLAALGLGGGDNELGGKRQGKWRRWWSCWWGEAVVRSRAQEVDGGRTEERSACGGEVGVWGNEIRCEKIRLLGGA
jgi:hypothetical protein